MKTSYSNKINIYGNWVTIYVIEVKDEHLFNFGQQTSEMVKFDVHTA
jgi:hypothetical protein